MIICGSYMLEFDVTKDNMKNNLTMIEEKFQHIF
jgi:hypothetical protein